MKPEDLDLLDLAYQNTKDFKEFKSFFLCVKDYVEYTQSQPDLVRITDGLVGEKVKLLKVLETAEKKALKELDSAEKYISSFSKNKPKNEEKEEDRFPNYGLIGLVKYKKGYISMNGLRSQNISNFLAEEARRLSQEAQNKIVQKYGAIETKQYGINGELIFSKQLKLLHDLLQDYNAKRQEEIWGCWDFLKLIPKITPFFFERDDRPFYANKFNYLDQDLITEYVYLHMLGKGEKSMMTKVEDIVSNFKVRIARLHLYLKKELSNKSIEKPVIKQKSERDDSFMTAVDQSKARTLISQNELGEYFYKGNKISIPKDTIYFKVFDILYHNHDQNGFISYSEIEEKLIKKGLPPMEDIAKRNKRIQNAISNKNQGLFRAAKVNGKSLKNSTLKGDLLVETIPGKGLRINNPVLPV